MKIGWVKSFLASSNKWIFPARPFPMPFPYVAPSRSQIAPDPVTRHPPPPRHLPLWARCVAPCPAPSPASLALLALACCVLCSPGGAGSTPAAPPSRPVAGAGFVPICRPSPRPPSRSLREVPRNVLSCQPSPDHARQAPFCSQCRQFTSNDRRSFSDSTRIGPGYLPCLPSSWPFAPSPAPFSHCLECCALHEASSFVFLLFSPMRPHRGRFRYLSHHINATPPSPCENPPKP
jgi:hypothetical protein